MTSACEYLRLIVVVAGDELGRGPHGESGREQVRGAADRDVGERRGVAGTRLRLRAADQVRRKILAQPHAVLPQRDRVAVDEHLRFVGLHAADDDRRVGLATHVLNGDVGQPLQHVVDLRVREVGERLTADEARRRRADVDRRAAAAADGRNAADRPERREVGLIQRHGDGDRRTGHDGEVREDRREIPAARDLDTIDAGRHGRAKGAVRVGRRARGRRSAETDARAGYRHAAGGSDAALDDRPRRGRRLRDGGRLRCGGGAHRFRGRSGRSGRCRRSRRFGGERRFRGGRRRLRRKRRLRRRRGLRRRRRVRRRGRHSGGEARRFGCPSGHFRRAARRFGGGRRRRLRGGGTGLGRGRRGGRGRVRAFRRGRRGVHSAHRRFAGGDRSIAVRERRLAREHHCGDHERAHAGAPQ